MANSDRLSGSPSPGRVVAIIPIFVTVRSSCTGSQRSAFTPGTIDHVLMTAKARGQRPLDLARIFRIDIVLDHDHELQAD